MLGITATAGVDARLIAATSGVAPRVRRKWPPPAAARKAGRVHNGRGRLQSWDGAGAIRALEVRCSVLRAASPRSTIRIDDYPLSCSSSDHKCRQPSSTRCASSVESCAPLAAHASRARPRHCRTAVFTSAAARLCAEMVPSPPASICETMATTSRCSSSAWCASSTVSSRPDALMPESVSSRCSRSSSDTPSAMRMLWAVSTPSPLSMARTMVTTSRCSSSAECASSSAIARCAVLRTVSSRCCRASAGSWKWLPGRCWPGKSRSASLSHPSPSRSSARMRRRTSRCSSSASCASSSVSAEPCAARFSCASARCSRSSSGRNCAAAISSAVTTPSVEAAASRWLALRQYSCSRSSAVASSSVIGRPALSALSSASSRCSFSSSERWDAETICAGVSGGEA
mmetsp:Transcript_36987/g.92036  ORF Transcript_36987/g.92036 Transcript_36987/m.92036 type:complete len:401 (+) Transcript_36987:79-1281(+)